MKYAAALLTFALGLPPAWAVGPRGPGSDYQTNPAKPGEPGNTPSKPWTKPKPPPEPEPIDPAKVAQGEAALRKLYDKYMADLDRAYEAYSFTKNQGDEIAWALASDQLYFDELQADLNFWDGVSVWSKVLGAGTWALVGAKVGMEIATKSPAIQLKIAGLLAVVTALQVESMNAYVDQKVEHYKTLLAKQREVIDERTKILLWQQDYGGMGQPPPSSNLEDLFPGCVIQTTCIPAWVCTPSNGRENCEKQNICDHRIVKC